MPVLHGTLNARHQPGAQIRARLLLRQRIMMRRIALLSLFLLAAVACTTTDPATGERTFAGGQYGGGAGQSPVGVIPEARLADAANGRSVLMSVDYPTRPGPHPLLVFFHAAGASHRDYIGLSSVWASHGYVVIKPNNAANIVDVLDNLDRIEQSYPELQGKIDRTKIGVGGHAAGALIAIRAAADARVTAIVAMAPEMTDTARTALAGLQKPALFLTGTRDPEDTEPDAFAIAPAGDKWLVQIAGAGPSAFSGTLHAVPAPNDTRDRRVDDPFSDPRRDPYDRNMNEGDRRRSGREGSAGLRLRGAFNTVKGLSLAFWDAYLRAKAEGRQELESATNRGNVTAQRK